MQIICLALLLSVLAIGVYAQTPVNLSDSSNVIVIKKEWRFQVRNPALDESPFIDIDERVQEEQDLRNTAAENRRRARLGVKPVIPPVRPPVEKKDGPASARYIYKIKVKNIGEKAVTALTLEYIFSEPSTQQEISRRQFVSKEEIAPGETVSLVFHSVAPPTGTINVKDADKKSGEQFSEQIIIQRVEYADGSVWQAVLKNQ
ncbi:MAG TPA: hypothetical protein VK892_01360 [Pyrinomonadaceae bacterium]|nr:hypothetical protein [Pyrinomonadaceae bacterium]